jgi:hypothetical protein
VPSVQVELIAGRDLDMAIARRIFWLSYVAPEKADEIVPRYSTDIAAAWLVIGAEFWTDYDGQRRFYFSVEELCSGKWLAQIRYVGKSEKDSRRFIGKGDSAPEAICRAAMEAGRFSRPKYG